MRNLGNVRRVVVKVGTSVLTTQNGTLNESAIEQIADVLARLRKSGKDVALVTCGAICAGAAKLRLQSYPEDMKQKQAAAAVGQSLLMNIYEKYFSRHDIPVAQLLLTKYTLQRDDSLANVTNTMNALLALGAIPIINENDPLITDEISGGDNDNIAVYAANIMRADLLVFLTRFDGLYDKNPDQFGAKVIREVTAITDAVKASAAEIPVALGVRSMSTKLAAAVAATKSNTRTIIANGYKPGDILDAINGANVGTYFDLAH